MLFAVALATACVLMSVAAPRTSLDRRSTVTAMVDGTAHRPYVRRVLVGGTVRGFEAVVPAGARAAIGREVARRPFVRDLLRSAPGQEFRFALVALLHLAALVGFAFALRRLLAAVGMAPREATLAAWLGLAMVPIHFGYQNYVYDFPALALFTLGCVLVAERRRRALYLLWPIGLLNKETFVLIVPVFIAFEHDRMPRAQLTRHVGAQLAISIVTVGSLMWNFRGNPGWIVEWHLWRNLSVEPSLRQLRHDLVYWGFLLFALVAGWRLNRVRRATLSVMAILAGATLFLGYLGEYRDFYEGWPLIFTAAAVGVWSRARGPAAAAAPAYPGNAEPGS